ncbi:hypothetical protein [Enterovirga aerilata]|uniref:Uncharacterized protein n=1 Tax=Enterovirga aerilata TaxID=2730920 RepID=A0A849IFZ0_9HYPH|nr:hypothetical protein [Enterovirga sp. DB1703]NNM75080.1 hypothetical protein [Enterovirga sp. DB1703]
MGELIGVLKAFDNFPIVQAAVGAVILFAGIYLVVRAGKDGRSGPPPAPGTIADTNLAAFAGPAAVIEHLREIRHNTAETAETLQRIERQQLLDSPRRDPR